MKLNGMFTRIAFWPRAGRQTPTNRAKNKLNLQNFIIYTLAIFKFLRTAWPVPIQEILQKRNVTHQITSDHQLGPQSNKGKPVYRYYQCIVLFFAARQRNLI